LPSLATAASRTQYPKVPKVTEECLLVDVLLVSVTFKSDMSLTTGAEIVVIRRSIAAAKRRKVPI